MTSPQTAPAAVVKQTERPHPLTPFVRGWIVLVAIVLGFGRSFLEQAGRDEGGFGLGGVGLTLLAVAGLALLAGLAGFVNWWFTRFVIDDEELRIETGAIFKRSRRISFERLQSVDVVQPLAARMFGLAELRLEVGAGDRGISLRYLSRRKAGQLRDFLLARAHGDRSTLAEAGAGPQASAFTDLRATDRAIVTIKPGQLVGGFLLSSEWIISVLAVIVAFSVTSLFDVTVFALPGLLPLLFGAVSLISRRVISQFNYTLADTGRGVRITRGLTNLTSQSLPTDRIQGIRISQSLLWRSLGWYRVDVDVLGIQHGNQGDGNNSDVSSILLPVATAEQLATALARVLPGVELDVPLTTSPKRCRWLRPFDGWTLRYGWNDEVAVAERGWLIRTRNVVPHAKTQSVRLAQGPIQRGFRLADVHLDTPRGPVNFVAQHLDQDAAREFVLRQLDRAREARGRGPLQIDADSDEPVLARFGIGGVEPLGGGGEARVYPLDDQRVLRVYRPGHESASTIRSQLKWFYDAWAQTPIGVELPQILQIGDLPTPTGARAYTIDRRLRGGPLTSWLTEAEEGPRRQTLESYLDVALRLRRLPLPQPGYARLLGDDPRPFDSLFALLDDQLRIGWGRVGARLQADLPDANGMIQRLRADLAAREAAPALVHGDYFAGNVYVDRGYDGVVRVSGVGDFSPHTLAADPMMDVAGAVGLLIPGHPDAEADAAWLTDLATEHLGPDTRHWITVYRRYYCVYYGDDPRYYPYALEQLRGA